MKKNTPLFALSTSLLLFIAFIIELVSLAKSFDNQFFGVPGYLVFQLIMVIILLLSVIFTCVTLFVFDQDKPTLLSMIGTFALYCIYNISLIFVYASYGPLSGGLIARLVFLFITVILILIALILQSQLLREEKANNFMLLAMCSLFIVSIISFIGMSSATPGTLIAETIFFTLGVLCGGYMYFNSYMPEPEYTPYKATYHLVSPVDKQEKDKKE